MSTQQDINSFRAQRLANTHDPLALMANIQTPFHPDQSSHVTYIQHPQPNNNFVQQPSFNTNYMPQLMQNPKDSSDPTTAMNMALTLLAKAFKVNTISTNNNQRSSLIPRNSQISQPGMNTSKDIKMQMVDDNVRNQYGNVNVVTTPSEGNGNGINGNPTRCYNCRGEGHYASNCTRIHYSKHPHLELSLTTLPSMIQMDQLRKCEECKYDKISYDKAYNEMQQKIKQLQAQLGDLKGRSSDTQCASNTLDPLPQKLEDGNVSVNHGKPPYSSRSKLYDVTPLPKSMAFPKVDETNALLNQVTSNSVPSSQESNVVKNDNVLSPGIFKMNPFKASRRSTHFYRLSHSEIVDIEKVAVRSSLRLPNIKCALIESRANEIHQNLTRTQISIYKMSYIIIQHLVSKIPTHYPSAIRPLFFTVEALEAEALELRSASLSLTLLYLASKSLSLTISLLQNDPSCYICGIQFGHSSTLDFFLYPLHHQDYLESPGQ
nr:hypothetical protein [Tanacetum cinerariifolium]